MTKRALIYRGPASYPGCPEAAAAMLHRSMPNIDIRYVGPSESTRLSERALHGASLYVQPGGGDSLERAYRKMRRHTDVIRDYVADGGRYLGICMGGYLAGHWRGFKLLPADSDQYITSNRADVRTSRDTLVRVDWRGQRRHMFFQDGPRFELPRQLPKEIVVLARYASNQEVAALVAPFGRGKVGVCGPHPEAPEDWYVAHRLQNPDGIKADLGHDLLYTLMS